MYLVSKCQIKWEIVSNFCGLFRMSELYLPKLALPSLNLCSAIEGFFIRTLVTFLVKLYELTTSYIFKSNSKCQINRVRSADIRDWQTQDLYIQVCSISICLFHIDSQLSFHQIYFSNYSNSTI